MSKPALSTRGEILAYLAHRTHAHRYLEIGVDTGETMRQVPCTERWGVDPAPTLAAVRSATAFFPETSEAFLGRLDALAHQTGMLRSSLFDLVFIDGFHAADTVVREVTRLAPYVPSTGFLVVHDVCPPDEGAQLPDPQPGVWCGDVWKAIVRLRAQGIHDVRTLDTDLGVAVIKPFGGGNVPACPLPFGLTWQMHRHVRPTQLGLVTPDDFVAWLGG